ncbi:MAG: DNA topoisomerase IB [Acidimicrobiia bacterium]
MQRLDTVDGFECLNGLVYGLDDVPGIQRRGRRRFTYIRPDGSRVDDRRTLERINRLAVPPAWTDVWISTSPNTHLQATGRDARGRKQSRYHPEFRAQRDATKFDQLPTFGTVLPKLRLAVEDDLRCGRPTFERQVALVVHIIDDTGIRVGNEEYARTNGTFGVTTLRKRHVVVDGGSIELRFRGKHSRRHRLAVDDRRVVRLIRNCQDLPGQMLFSFEDDEGVVRNVRSSDVNDYVRDATGADFTAKTLRTWRATTRATSLLAQRDTTTVTALNDVLDEVATDLGNTRAVCRKSYVHPVVIDLFRADELRAMWRSARARVDGLDEDESKVLSVLRRASAAALPPR